MDYVRKQISEITEYQNKLGEDEIHILDEHIELLFKIEIERIITEVREEFTRALDLLMTHKLIIVTPEVRQEIIEAFAERFKIDYYRFNSVAEANNIIRRDIYEQYELTNILVEEICSHIFPPALVEKYFNWLALIAFPSIESLSQDLGKKLKEFDGNITKMKGLLKTSIYSHQTVFKGNTVSYLFKQMVKKSFKRVMDRKKKNDMFSMFRLTPKGLHPENEHGIEYFYHMFLVNLEG